MAKITFTADDGSVQEFDVTIPVTIAPAIMEVDVVLTDNTTKKFILA